MKKQLQILKKKIEIVGREIMKRKGPTHPSNFSRKRKSSSGSIQKKRNRIQSFSPDLEVDWYNIKANSFDYKISFLQNWLD